MDKIEKDDMLTFTVYGEMAACLLYKKGKLECFVCNIKIPQGMGYTYYKRDEKRGAIMCNKCRDGR